MTKDPKFKKRNRRKVQNRGRNWVPAYHSRMTPLFQLTRLSTRVINVLRHWVDQHFYDFEREPALLERLRGFLESVDGKPMRKWVQSVLKTLARRAEQSEDSVAHVFNRAPPPVLRAAPAPPRAAWHPLALHPVELARQLTLLEFQLYRQVRPSELVGAVWTKKDKEKSSPNLLRIIKHTTNVSANLLCCELNYCTL